MCCAHCVREVITVLSSWAPQSLPAFLLWVKAKEISTIHPHFSPFFSLGELQENKIRPVALPASLLNTLERKVLQGRHKCRSMCSLPYRTPRLAEVWTTLLCLQAAREEITSFPQRKRELCKGLVPWCKFSYLVPGKSINRKGKICRV